MDRGRSSSSKSNPISQADFRLCCTFRSAPTPLCQPHSTVVFYFMRIMNMYTV